MANLFSIPKQHMENWGDALITKNKPWTTTPEYHQWGTADLTKQKSKELSQNYGNLAAGAFELAAPALALGASPIYDIAQAVWKYGQDPNKYLSRTDQDAKEAQENIDPSVKAALEARGVTGDYFGADLSGILTAINQEDVLSSAWNRMLGASWPLADRMKKGLNNVEKFGGKIYNYMHGPQMRFKKQQLMNQRKQTMQDTIRRAEAIEAAKKTRPTNIPGTPIVPTGGGISDINIQKKNIGMPENLTYTPPRRTVTPRHAPHPHRGGEQGGGGGLGKGQDPGGGAAGSPFKYGGRIDKALGGRSRYL